MSPTLVYLASVVTACALISSAVWKATHQREFRSAFRSRAGSFAPLDRVVAIAVPVAELGAGAAVVLQGFVGRGGLIVSGVAVAAFAAFALLPAKDAAGCGCWRSVDGADQFIERPVFAARNALLVALLVPAAIRPTSPPLGVGAVCVAIAALFGLLALESPEFVRVARFRREVVSG
jgi:hypothetical protein